MINNMIDFCLVLDILIITNSFNSLHSISDNESSQLINSTEQKLFHSTDQNNYISVSTDSFVKFAPVNIYISQHLFTADSSENYINKIHNDTKNYHILNVELNITNHKEQLQNETEIKNSTKNHVSNVTKLNNTKKNYLRERDTDKENLTYASTYDLPKQQLSSNVKVNQSYSNLVAWCSSKQSQCNKLPVDCLICDLNDSCIYGSRQEASCLVRTNVTCSGVRKFNLYHNCRYCYQTTADKYKCQISYDCKISNSPHQQKYQTNCTVKDNVLCLGSRTFPMMKLCRWTSGKHWSTALILSITLGGFGADRFYLGLWREGIGKLFSFGGLGVWTIVDVILVAFGYITPADGSCYV